MTEAIFRQEGTEPDLREELIMSVMMGQRAGRDALTRAEGMGSREQVEALALETSLATSVAFTGEKVERQQ